MKQKVLFNPTKKAFYLREFGGIKISPNQILDPRKYKISPEVFNKAVQAGPLAEALKNKDLLLVDEPTPTSTKIPKYTETKTPFRRPKLIAPPTKEDTEDFIEQLKAEFSADQLVKMTDTQVAKSTERLISSADALEGIRDPLEE